MNKEELIEYKIYNQWEDDVRKCENRLLRITRNIKRNIKKHDKVYIPPIRFYYDSDTDCGLQCNDETKDCKKCDSFFILEIKVSAIIDIYLDEDNYLLYVEQDVLSSKEYEIVLLKYNKDTDERLLKEKFNRKSFDNILELVLEKLNLKEKEDKYEKR